jgi:N-acetylneuraminate synthase
VKIGPYEIGTGRCLVIAELGQNANGDVDLAIQMIRAAKSAGSDMAKFQKRTPSLCVPLEQRHLMRDTPRGPMTYLQYREWLEFDRAGYDAIDAECRRLGMLWTASAWDLPSVEFLAAYDVPAIKIASASLTDHALLRAVRGLNVPVILSTGMSTPEEIDAAVEVLGREDLVIMQCTSTYPSAPEELNLRCIPAFAERYGVPIGFSGHELGIAMTLAAVVLGATVIEKHFTCDRSWFGSDQSASLEPKGFAALTRDVRKWEKARGDGVKRRYDSELSVLTRLRRVQ